MWECASQRCGLRYAAPQLDERSLQAVYRKFYYPDLQRGGTTAYEATPVEILHQVFRYAIAEFGDLSGWRLLDYGCGRGTLCRVALSYAVQPVGIESDPNARKEAAACGCYPVYESLAELLASRADAQFDMAILWEVIEHLREPWVDLANLRRVLSASGFVLVATPNAASGRARLLRRRWSNYTNPTHLYYFTRQCLGSVLRRSGFSAVREWKVPITYPHHRWLRRTLYTALRACKLQGDLLFVAQP